MYLHGGRLPNHVPCDILDDGMSRSLIRVKSREFNSIPFNPMRNSGAVVIGCKVRFVHSNEYLDHECLRVRRILQRMEKSCAMWKTLLWLKLVSDAKGMLLFQIR